MTDEKNNGRKNFSFYYGSKINTLLFRWIDIRKKQVLQKLLDSEQQKKNKPLRILEIGAGTGNILASINGSYQKYVLDINQQLVAIAQQRGLTGTTGTIDKGLPYKNKCFDVILTIDAIEHFSYRHKSMNEMARILKDDGLMIHFTPPYDSCSWVLAERLHNNLLRTTSDHVSPFTRESMQHLLQRWCSEIKIKWINLGLTMYAVGRKKRI